MKKNVFESDVCSNWYKQAANIYSFMVGGKTAGFGKREEPEGHRAVVERSAAQHAAKNENHIVTLLTLSLSFTDIYICWIPGIQHKSLFQSFLQKETVPSYLLPPITAESNWTCTVEVNITSITPPLLEMTSPVLCPWYQIPVGLLSVKVKWWHSGLRWQDVDVPIVSRLLTRERGRLASVW